MTPDIPPTEAGLPDGLPALRSAVLGFVRGRVKDAALADDLTQETLLRFQKGLSALRTVGSLQSWVLQIARNVIVDHFRKVRETEVYDEENPGEAAATPADPDPDGTEGLGADLAAYVRSVVDKLPAHYREAIRLTEFEGVTQVELARRLGLSVSAAKSRVQRGRALLRKEMERCCRWETDRYGAILNVESRSACDCEDESESEV